MSPQRIQLSRTKGWKMPENTVKVDRTTKYGNPFRDSEHSSYGESSVKLANGMYLMIDDWWTTATAVELFRQWVTNQTVMDPASDNKPLTQARLPARPDLSLLRGKNLACWCKPGTPCHADVLLQLANQEPAA